MCAIRETIARRQNFFQRLTRGLAEATAFILDDANKPDVLRTLSKHLRLARAEEAEASYRVLRIMTTLDLAPNPAAFKAVQRIVAKVNPKIAQVEIDQIIDAGFVRTLETSGVLPELRRKVRP